MLALVPRWLVLTYVGVVGAVVGSFLNVVIARLPAGESIVRPRSRCPRCHASIAWYDNVPVVSWLVLRGRCRRCGEPISARYPLVELLMAALALATYVRLGPTWQLLVWLPLVAALLAVVFLDIDHFWVPDVITYPAMVWAALGSFLPGGPTPLEAALGLLPALFLLVFAWLFERVTGREGMGLGDVKLLAVLGLALGAVPTLIVLILASVQGSVVGLLVLATGGHRTGEGEDGERRESDAGTPGADRSLDVTAAGATRERPAAGEPLEPATDEPATNEPATGSGGQPRASEGEDDWVPPARAIPFGPFLVLGCYEVLLLPAIFLDVPLRLLSLGGAAP